MSGSGSSIETTTNTRPTKTSPYNGLTWIDELQLWKVELTIHRAGQESTPEIRWVGAFTSEIEAAVAYDEALYKILIQEPALRLPGFNIGIPNQDHTNMIREAAFAAEAHLLARISARTSSASAAAASSAAASASAETPSSSSSSRVRVRTEDRPSRRKRRRTSDSAAASSSSDSAPPVDGPFIDDATLRAAMCIRIVQEFYDLNWICANQQLLMPEYRELGFFKIKFSIFGTSWAFAFRAQPNHDFPLFLDTYNANLAKTKLLHFITSFFDGRTSATMSAREITDLMRTITYGSAMAFHPAIFYSHEIVLDNHVRNWEQFPMRYLQAPPPPGPYIVPVSPRPSPPPARIRSPFGPVPLRRSEEVNLQFTEHRTNNTPVEEAAPENPEPTAPVQQNGVNGSPRPTRQ